MFSKILTNAFVMGAVPNVSKTAFPAIRSSKKQKNNYRRTHTFIFQIKAITGIKII